MTEKVYTITKEFIKRINEYDEECKKIFLEICIDRVYRGSILQIVESLPDGTLYKVS